MQTLERIYIIRKPSMDTIIQHYSVIFFQKLLLNNFYLKYTYKNALIASL